jgi:hypothetical protein
MADLTPDYSKRDYLLPPGCKDLIDVLNLKDSRTEKPLPWYEESPEPSPQGPMVELPASMLVKDLAQRLQMKPFKIIANLMEIGVFANVNQSLDFDTAARLLARYGFTAKRAGGA